MSSKSLILTFILAFILSIVTYISMGRAASAQTVSQDSEAKLLQALATLPELAEIIQRIGGARVQVDSLLSGQEDPHYVDALPSYVQKASRADLLCFIGLDLEVGWLPRVLSRSGRAIIQRGGKGHCEAGKSVQALGVPSGPIDRSMGDIHAHGNPHFNLSPKSLSKASEEILNTLSRLRPQWSQEFETAQKEFVQEMRELQSEIQNKFDQALGNTKDNRPKVMEYHQEFTYFLELYGIPTAGAIEEKPGVPPSAARLAQVSRLAQEQSVALALANPSSPQRVLRRFEQMSKVPVLRLPIAVTPSQPEYSNIKKLQHYLADQLLERLDDSN